MQTMSRFLLALLMLPLSVGAVLGAEEAVKDPKPADFTEAVIVKAISFMPAELQALLTPCLKDIVSASKPDSTKPDTRFGYAAKEDEAARKAFTSAFDGVRKAVEAGKSATDLKVELGRLAQHVIAICQPYRTDKAAFDSAERPVFEQKLDSLCSTLKADFDKFQRVNDPAKFATETSAKAQAEAKKLAAGGKRAEEVPSAVFSLASNSLADIWQSLLTKPGGYIGNKSSKKFHLPTCRHLPAEKNRVQFKTREDAIAAGYDPCKLCKP